MRLLCVVWALALWGACDGWVRRRHHRSLDPKHLRSINPRVKERGRQVRAPRPTPRVPNPSTAKHAAGAQQRTVLLHDLQTGRGQCLVNGMALYDGAAWAPDPCTTCMCDHGTRVCAVKDCAKVQCPLGTLRTPPGACCPVCTQPGATRPTSVATTERPRDKAVKEDKKLKWKPQKEKKILEAVLPAKGKGALSSSKRKKNAAERRQERILIKQEPLAEKDPTTKSKMGDTLKRPLVVRDAAVLPTQEAVSRGKTIGSPREVILAKNESVDKKQPRPSTVPLEAAPTNVLRQEDKKGVPVKRLPVPTADKPQSNKTSKQDTLNKGRHLGSRQEKDQLKASGSNSSSGPSSRVKGPPELEIETHMPSLPTNCLLAESTIACANTKMKYLPMLSDPGLKTLYLAENEIAHLSADAFAGLPNLEWLDLSKNKLDDAGVHVDAFKNLTKLKRLNLDGNRLTAIPTLPPLLQELKMNDNGIQGLQNHSFHGLYKLLTLELEGNQFHDGNVYPLAFKPLRSLIYLRLDRNRFRAVPSGLPTSLQELHLDNNRIEQVSEGLLNKTLNLSVLVLSNNRLQEDRIATRAWIDLLKLESLDLSYNRLVHVPSFLPRGLRQLTLHHNQIERIPGYVFAHMKPGLEFLHLSHNHMRDDGIHATSFLGLYKSLAELLLDNNHLHSVPRGLLNLKALQVLRLNFNKIRYVPLNSICDTRVSVDSSLISVHLENNMIDRHLIPPTAFSCIKTYYSVVLRPQQDEDEDY